MGEMGMTQGEMMIWAAVFARECHEIHNPPGYLVTNDDDDAAWVQWERSQVTSAAEVACGRVALLRESIGDIADGFGESDELEMAKEMLGVVTPTPGEEE